MNGTPLTDLHPGARVKVARADDQLATVTRVGFPYADDVWVLVDGERAETVCHRSQVEEA